MTIFSLKVIITIKCNVEIVRLFYMYSVVVLVLESVPTLELEQLN